jgi:hypothetical protein
VTNHCYLQALTPTAERADGLSGRVINDNGRVPTRVFDYYENVFYAIYNKPIRVCDTDMGTALQDCIEILGIAKYLGCVNVISKQVEVALMKHGQLLFRSIQKMPVSWVDMALNIKSETIFTECMIHLAGNWKNHRAEAAMKLKDAPMVRYLAEKYHRVLLAKGKALELSVMSTYPGDMASPIGEVPIRREEYAKDILVWMALCFCRHWLGQRIIQEKGYQSKDSGYETYKQLGTAGEAYMDKPIMNQFHAKFPLTKKAMNVLENHLLEIKQCIKNIVEKDVLNYPVNYLTCTQFNREDLPWLKEEVLPAPMTGKRGRRWGGNDIAKHNRELAKKMQQQERGDSLETDDAEELNPEDYDAEVESDGTAKRAKYE